MTTISKDINGAVALLKNGEVVAFPTETVYGLGALICEEAALKTVFSLKERPLFDPLIVHVSSIEQAKSLVKAWPESAQVIADNFWPGPVTIVLPKKDIVGDLITAGLETVGLRFPRHTMAVELIKKVGVPVAAPSANKFGYTSPTNAEHVVKEFGESSLLVLDGGPCDVGVESTVLGLLEGCVEIYRPGMISKDILETALKNSGVKCEVLYSQNPASPGQLTSHYQPGKPLILVARDTASEDVVAAAKRVTHVENPRGFEIKFEHQPELCARLLYAELRNGSLLDVDYLVGIEPSDADSRFDAIRDRLRRAASVRLGPKK